MSAWNRLKAWWPGADLLGISMTGPIVLHHAGIPCLIERERDTLRAHIAAQAEELEAFGADLLGALDVIADQSDDPGIQAHVYGVREWARDRAAAVVAHASRDRRMREALAWYANWEHYSRAKAPNAITKDGGKRACHALGEGEPEGGDAT